MKVVPETAVDEQKRAKKRQATDGDVESRAMDVAFNINLKKNLEAYSKEANGGGWWVEQHCGSLFFCCRCVGAL